jgi:hypothetical protein
MPRTFARTIPCLVGAAAGGALGYLTFHWGLGQGFYAPMLPGASLGLGCYGLSRHPSRPRWPSGWSPSGAPPRSWSMMGSPISWPTSTTSAPSR